jgi:hypothetical protein
MRTSSLLVCSLVLALTTSTVLAGQTVWKWVDEKGVTHFSDQPVPGATKMELNSSSRDSAAPAPVYTPPSQSADRPTQQGPAYSRFVFEQPQQDESVINTGGNLRISLASSPALLPGHSITVYLDGGKIEDFPPSGLSHELANVPRGTHTLRAVITNPQRAVVQETPPVTFHVRQNSISQPPVGPTLRNPPKRPGAGNKMPAKQPSYAALNGGPAVVDPNTNRPPPPAKTMPAGPRSGN